jgi:ABC-type glycerol-3-phosphate transport system permease component
MSGSALTRRREPVAFTVRVLLYIAYGLPLLWIVLTSLKDQGNVLTSQASLLFSPTLDAYREAFDNPGLVSALRQSAIIATGTMVLCVVLAVPAAYWLAKVNSTLAVAALGLLIVLQMVPQTANVIPLFAVFSRWSLLDTNHGLIFADAVMLLPWATLLLRPFYMTIPDSLEEASALDGAGRVRTFFGVILPMVRNGVATVAALVFLVSWGEFLYAINLLLTPTNYPMSALIAQQTSSFGVNWPGLMALAVISSIPLLIVYTFSYKLLREGLAVGSVK